MNILTVCALLLIPASPTPLSITPVPITSAPMAAVTPAGVIVKIGEASLEEYKQGNPANRVLLLRSR